MVPRDATTHPRNSWPWWRWTLAGLCTLALALSAYLSWHYLTGGAVIGCGGGNSCDQVLTSRWSAVRGVLPVSGLAMGAYLAMLVAIFFIGPATAPPDRRLAWSAMLLLAGAVAGSAIWFTIVQRWIIGAFCPYCMATHITGLLLGALICWRAPSQFDVNAANTAAAAAPIQTIPSTPPQNRRLPTLALPLVGLALAGILAICQIAFPPPAVFRSGASQSNLPSIDPHAVPLLGSPDASYVVALLFDYNCPHCQQVHSLLDDAMARYDGKLAFALFPSPLNSQCNAYIPRDVDEFKTSCELAKIGLAVWIARREAFPAFDHWMFSPEPGEVWRPRSPDSAKAKAVELVGQAKFDTARADPWIDRYLQTSVRMYGDTINPDQSGNAVPKLVFGARWITPEPHDAGDLLLILQNNLALPKP